MKKSGNIAEKSSFGRSRGFQISEQPVVESRRSDSAPVAASADGSGVGLGSPEDNSLSILARDPRSLFIYWGLGWAKRFALAELAPAKLRLRIFRQDGTEETTSSIDLSTGFAFADVSSPSTHYYCELGMDEDEGWKSLARSGSAETPAAAMSDDLSADFATLPLHLSFQRLLNIFRASPARAEILSEAVSKLQTEARALQGAMSPLEWFRLVEMASDSVEAKPGLDLTGIGSPEIAALLRTVKQDSSRWVASPEKFKRWQEVGEQFAGSSWSSSSAGSSSWQSGRGS